MSGCTGRVRCRRSLEEGNTKVVEAKGGHTLRLGFRALIQSYLGRTVTIHWFTFNIRNIRTHQFFAFSLNL